MRRIKSKYGEAKKQKKRQTTIGVILIIVMFGSVFGVIVGSLGWGDDNSKVEYKGFEFIKQNNLWTLKINDFNFIFRYTPYEVPIINSDVKYLNNYYNKPLYISSDSSEATSEIYVNLDQVVQRMHPACLYEESCKEDEPLKTCEDNFIIIQEKNETNIIQEDNCVFIIGPQENLTQISDVFLFKILGVE